MLVFYHSCEGESPSEEPPQLVKSMEYVHSSAGSWNGAADDLVAALTRARVEHGHIISVSACNLNPQASAEFQCHFDRTRPGGGQPGQVSYKCFNHEASFSAMHHQIGVAGSGKKVISVTGSSNENGRSVLYIFYWDPASDA